MTEPCTTCESSQAWRQFVDTAAGLISQVQGGGSYNVTVDPYLTGVSVKPAAPAIPPTLITTGLLVLGGILVLLILWK